MGLMLMAALSVAQLPDAPPVDVRLSRVEARLDRVEEKLGMKSARASAVAAPIPAPVVAPAVAPPVFNGNWSAVSTVGFPTYSQPQVYYYATPEGAFMSSGGSCANGQCGGSSGGKRGLFGRRR